MNESAEQKTDLAGAREGRELANFRMAAAFRSGGTSRPDIKQLVVRMIAESRISGELLDFGAGTGELLKVLDHFDGLTVHGADILARPADLAPRISWHQQDLNDELKDFKEHFDAVVCSEVIEHLENPRSTLRNIAGLLKPGGKLILTTPNQENIRSFLTLVFRGHFAAFLGPEYPAHITALLRMDLARISREAGFSEPRFRFTDYGWMPITKTTWQIFSRGTLKGRLFSDNLGMIVTKGQSCEIAT
jgi:2-polyprenyl-3-methyl-5-hydroxy-6-metoxy-1,4-benzoquinol methylase